MGIKDSIDAAFRYVKTCARGLASDERILAYVETARVMARYLEQIGVAYRCVPKYSDYYPTLDGALPGGRTMDPQDFDAARLGVEALGHVRPTNPGQLVFGRMHINAFEAHAMLGFGTSRNPEDGVLFGGHLATVSQWTDTTIVVHVPLDAQTGPVVMKRNGQERAIGTYTVQTPQATGLTPPEAPIGTLLKITGENFDFIRRPGLRPLTISIFR